jgi:hypothetical protein
MCSQVQYVCLHTVEAGSSERLRRARFPWVPAGCTSQPLYESIRLACVGCGWCPPNGRAGAPRDREIRAGRPSRRLLCTFKAVPLRALPRANKYTRNVEMRAHTKRYNLCQRGPGCSNSTKAGSGDSNGSEKLGRNASTATDAVEACGVVMLRIPHCLDSPLKDGGEVVSPTHRPRSAPHKQSFSASGPHFC